MIVNWNHAKKRVPQIYAAHDMTVEVSNGKICSMVKRIGKVHSFLKLVKEGCSTFFLYAKNVVKTGSLRYCQPSIDTVCAHSHS